MIGPEKLQSMPDEMAQLMRELQDWGIQDIASRIARFGVVSSTSEYMLTTMMEQNAFESDWRKKIAEVMGVTEKRIDELFQEAAKANYIYDKRTFEGAGIPFTPFEDNRFVQDLTRNIIAQTQGDFQNITKSMGFARKINGKTVFEPLAQFYQHELNLATTKVTAGMQTFGEAVKESVVRMADSGIRTVTYHTGHKDRIDVSARRAVLSAMRDLTVRQAEYNADIIGVTTFEFSWHGGHRPSHGWGGRRYDRLGVQYPRLEDVYEKYGGGTLDDYNCYHEQYAVFPDGPPNYTDEELEKMEAKEFEEVEYEGKKYNAYDARQQQRALERIMHKQDSTIAGYSGAQPELAEALQQAKIARKQTSAQYKAFSKAMGLRTEFERVHTGVVNSA